MTAFKIIRGTTQNIFIIKFSVSTPDPNRSMKTNAEHINDLCPDRRSRRHPTKNLVLYLKAWKAQKKP